MKNKDHKNTFSCKNNANKINNRRYKLRFYVFSTRYFPYLKNKKEQILCYICTVKDLTSRQSTVEINISLKYLAQFYIKSLGDFLRQICKCTFLESYWDPVNNVILKVWKKLFAPAARKFLTDRPPGRNSPSKIPATSCRPAASPLWRRKPSAGWTNRRSISALL